VNVESVQGADTLLDERRQAEQHRQSDIDLRLIDATVLEPPRDVSMDLGINKSLLQSSTAQIPIQLEEVSP
jgi:hypothetical protein